LVAVLVAATGGYIGLVGQTGLESANRNLCDLYKSVTGLPFASCRFESLFLTGWKWAALVAFVLLVFDLGRWVKKKRSKGPASASSHIKATPKIEIAYGEDGPFEKLTNAQIYRLERMLLIEFKNPYQDRAITNCKLEVTTAGPLVGQRRSFVLRDNFTLAGGDHVFIPFVSYGESRTIASGVAGDSGIAVCAPEGSSPHFLSTLPVKGEHVIALLATAIEAAACEEQVVVWVGAGTRLRIRKFEASEDADYIGLEEATREAYGAARGTAIGEAAEKLNSNGVLAWFAFYYHTREIPVFGNVRDSSKFEPVLFRNIEIKLEDGKLIGREIYGDLVWENMKVKKRDQLRLLALLKEHANDLAGNQEKRIS
jgi:hypothetical protein